MQPHIATDRQRLALAPRPRWRLGLALLIVFALASSMALAQGGGPAAVVTDINRQGAGTQFIQLARVDNTLFFIRYNQGAELWKSDGTAAGMVLAQDLLPGAAASYPFGLTIARDRLFFSAESASLGRELWVAPLRELGVGIHEVFLPYAGAP